MIVDFEPCSVLDFILKTPHFLMIQILTQPKFEIFTLQFTKVKP